MYLETGIKLPIIVQQKDQLILTITSIGDSETKLQLSWEEKMPFCEKLFEDSMKAGSILVVFNGKSMGVRYPFLDAYDKSRAIATKLAFESRNVDFLQAFNQTPMESIVTGVTVKVKDYNYKPTRPKLISVKNTVNKVPLSISKIEQSLPSFRIFLNL